MKRTCFFCEKCYYWDIKITFIREEDFGHIIQSFMEKYLWQIAFPWACWLEEGSDECADVYLSLHIQNFCSGWTTGVEVSVVSARPPPSGRFLSATWNRKSRDHQTFSCEGHLNFFFSDGGRGQFVTEKVWLWQGCLNVNIYCFPDSHT